MKKISNPHVILESDEEENDIPLKFNNEKKLQLKTKQITKYYIYYDGKKMNVKKILGMKCNEFIVNIYLKSKRGKNVHQNELVKTKEFIFKTRDEAQDFHDEYLELLNETKKKFFIK